MYKKLMGSSDPILVGDVLSNRLGLYGARVVSQVYIDDTTYLILQEVTVDGPKAVSLDVPLLIRTPSRVRSLFGYICTKSDVISKGDVFKDQWDRYYVAETSRILWNLSTGTWGSVSAGRVTAWKVDGVAPLLTPVRTINNGNYSNILAES